MTIKGYDKRFGNYLLKFPNDEVRYGFMDFLVPYYTSVVDDERGFYLGKFVRELESGDVDAFLTRLQASTPSINVRKSYSLFLSSSTKKVGVPVWNQ